MLVVSKRAVRLMKNDQKLWKLFFFYEKGGVDFWPVLVTCPSEIGPVYHAVAFSLPAFYWIPGFLAKRRS
jgi:hypothetical protein